MVLDDVTEYEITTEGKVATKLDQILLNGNNIALLVPGCDPGAVTSAHSVGAAAPAGAASDAES
eukprot:CAMPEP_0172598110 /NCGR_PEP_ID=MMETSP1068-20121228/18112_1 /TAXON_ID=35684 /ORGANISM="Pseudopedinella elastica, Strain CCMP716" /LENGTH=63 /DNA_ID=CAMNT_0013397847 /DNA_START=276 /DNA_END=467 /DNA_ORIENTATION=+